MDEVKPVYVLDACALLRLVQDEPGADKVAEILGRAARGECRVHLHQINFGEAVYRIYGFPRSSARRYAQMLEVRHFGMDAEIQRPRMANFGLLHCRNEALVQPSSYRPWPGYRHPCRYDGISGSAGLVYNDERSSVGSPC